MKIIDKFEKKLGRSCRELDSKSLADLMKNEDFKEFFNNPDTLLELLESIEKYHQDENFKGELKVLISTILMVKSQATINRYFNDFENDEIDKDTLKLNIEGLMMYSDPITSMNAILSSMLGFEGYTPKKEDVIRSSMGLIKLYDTLSNNYYTSYKIRCDLLDLLYTVRDEYFKLTEDDIKSDLGDDYEEWEESRLKELHNFEDKLLAEKNISLPEINIKPEELGIIDITKLRKE